MSKYAGTQTEKNLLAAFAGESQARNKYIYFSQVAQKDGLEKIVLLRFLLSLKKLQRFLKRLPVTKSSTQRCG